VNSILNIQNLTKKYGSKYAIKNLSFDIPQGTIFGILGPNGSGKTTTLGIALQILNATKGNVNWFGQTAAPSSLKRIGAILENPNFYPYLSGENNLKIVADIKGVSYERIDMALKIVNLYERRKSAFKTYSLGMKQRLAIGAALLNDPEVLVLDEPTNGLDPQGIAEIRGIINKVGESGKTIILASHLLDEVEKVCTDLAVLKNGELLFSGKVSELNTNPSQAVIEVKSEEMNELKTALENYPFQANIQVEKGAFIVTLKEEKESIDLNKFLVEKEIVVSHLFQRKQGLEAQFLELTSK